MSVTFRDRTEMMIYAKEHLFNGNEQVLAGVLQDAMEALERTIPRMDKKYAQEWNIIHKEKPAVIDSAKAEERKTALSRVMENKITFQVIDAKYDLARQFVSENYREPVKDAYEHDAWVASFDENDLRVKAVQMVKSYMHDVLEEIAEKTCSQNPPALKSKEYNMVKNIETIMAKDEPIKDAFEKAGVRSLLDTRKDGEAYKMTHDAGAEMDVDKWFTETSSQKLYEAVLFSNGKINHGAGLQALSNIARNGHTPEDALYMIARGELDNQGKSMMTNEDVSTLWIDVLNNPKCPPELAMEIAMHAASAKNISPVARDAVIKEAAASLDRVEVEIFDRKFPEMDGILGAFDKLAAKEITTEQLAEQMSEILVEHGYLDKNFSEPETGFPEKGSPQMDSREGEIEDFSYGLTLPGDVIS